MQDRTAGWRTGWSRRRLHGDMGAGGWTAPAPAWPVPAPGAAAPGELHTPGYDMATGQPWRNVEWTLALAALLAYIWTVTTYRLPIGAPSMVVALVGLLFLPNGLRLPPFMLLMAAYVGWAFLGVMQSDYPAASGQSFEVLWKVTLIALVVVNAVRTRGQQRVFMFVFLGAFALYPVRGALFNYLGGYTLFGRAIWNNVFANPNDLAAITLLQLSMALALFVREPKGWPKLAAAAGMGLLPLIVLLTQSRGAILALVAFTLLVIAGQRRRGRTIVIIGLIGAVVALAAPSTVWDRLSGLRNATDTENLRSVDVEGSAMQRFEIWKVARAIAGDHPVKGVGIGAYKDAHARYAMRSDFHPIARGRRDTHSTYLNVLAETGTVGLVLWAALFVPVLLRAERTRRRAAQVLPNSAQQIFYLELGLLAFFTSGIFGSYAGLSFTYIHLALLWAVTDTTANELSALQPARR